MTEVISVRFKNNGKIYYFDPNGITAEKDQFIIVETSKGLEYAECVQGNHCVEDSGIVPPLRPVIRIATEEDTHRMEQNKQKEAEAISVCQEKIIKHGLDMKLVDVEYSFEGNKILFFFTSEGRVDFRDLVKDLASVFRTRIELRQIGIRDEARMFGGLGICGRVFCCTQFLEEFQPVSIKMAKTQGLSLNPTKISGTCGRLMCCLKYEQEAYEELVKNVPKMDAFVQTPMGKGSVIDVNLLRGNIRVKLEDSPDAAIKTFHVSEVEVLGGKAKRVEYLALKAEGKGDPPARRPTITRMQSEPRIQAENQYAEPGKDIDTAENNSNDFDKAGRNQQQKNRRNRSAGKPKPPQNAAQPPNKQQPGKPLEKERQEKPVNKTRRRRRGNSGKGPNQPEKKTGQQQSEQTV